MQEPDGLNDGQRELESALKSLHPAAARIDPIVAAFTAGRKSSRHQLHLWRSATVLILLVCAASWLMPLKRNAAVQPRDFSESNIALRSPQPSPEPLAPQSLQALQQTVRDQGLDALPATKLPDVQLINLNNTF
jgi:hypothetical protein